jgi:excisionase family DNA binding protein
MRKYCETTRPEVAFMTIAQAATYMNLSRQSVLTYIEWQNLPATRMSPRGNWRIRKSELDAWVSARTRGGDNHLFPKPATV